MSKSFHEKFKQAKIYLLLYQPFFGSLILKLPVKEVNQKEICQTAWTDGKNIKFDEDFVTGLDNQEFAAILIHEILHVCFYHVIRSKNKDPYIFNIAADIVVNNIIVENTNSNKVKLPQDVVFERKYSGYSVEGVYDDIINSSDERKQMENKNDESNINNDLNKEKINITPQEKKEIEETLIQAHQYAKMYGNEPNGIGHELDYVLKSRIDWRRVLKQFIQSFPIDWDFQQKDRRYINSSFFLPTFGTGQMINIAIAIDVSGSISDKTLNHFLSETYQILQTFDRVNLYMICFDADIQNTGKINKKKDFFNFNIKGRGGTNFCPVFSHIKNERKFNYDGLVIFSDGYGSFPEKPPRIKTMWVLTSPVKPYFGKKVPYNEN